MSVDTPETLPQQIGQRLRDLRRKRGWSHRYVAGRLGIKHESQISQWENNTAGHMHSLSTLMLFADLYGVTIDYLVGRKFIDET